VGATNVLGTIIATSIIERAGRKQLLLASYAGMGASMLAMAAGFGLPALQGLSGAIAVLGTLAYILSFAIGAPLPPPRLLTRPLTRPPLLL
jgi:uncharacterized membrane protein